MKKLIWGILCLALIASCATFYKPDYKRRVRAVASTESELVSKLRVEVEEFQEKVEEVLVWRVKAMEYQQKIAEKGVLQNSDLVNLHEIGTKNYLEMREYFWTKIDKMKWVTDRDNRIAMVDSRTRIQEKKLYDKNEFTDDPPDYQTYFDIQISPFDDEGIEFLANFKMALASTLILYDNYLLTISLYQGDKKLRRLLNYDNSEEKRALLKITKSFQKWNNVKKAARAIDFFHTERSWEKRNNIFYHELNEYLNALVEGSFMFSKIDEFSYGDFFKMKVKRIQTSIGDYLAQAQGNTVNEISKVFGNSVGLVSFRKGKLLSLSHEEQMDIEGKMKPLDVLLEKTPFRLTDKFIPGHWGHVAIWAGTKEELQELGIWDHKDVRPYHQDIENGHRIIEALRPGVQINTLHHFLNIDDLAVLRTREELSREKKQKYLIHAFQQLGKKYDFNFDVQTDKKIVCSELAYVVYNEMKWPTEKAMGRYTISPDNVAEKAVGNGPFEPVIIYHDGKEIEGHLDQNFEHLLRLEYDLVSWE